MQATEVDAIHLVVSFRVCLSVYEWCSLVEYATSCIAYLTSLTMKVSSKCFYRCQKIAVFIDVVLLKKDGLH